MRKVFTLIAFLAVGIMLHGQAPAKMNYQAVVRNAQNQLAADRQITVRISVLKGSAEGSVVFEETHSVTTNANGLFTIDIGSGTPVNGMFSAIDWSHGPYFLRTEIDPEGGFSYTISGTSMILSVPYALYANKADSIIGGIPEKQGLSDVLAISNSAASQIRNVSPPTDARDAATKAYVDSLQALTVEILSKAGFFVKDIDGNFYSKVVIGTQTWLGSDLKTSRLNDGTRIAKVEDNNQWDSTDAPAYCWYNNDSAFASVSLGALYNWRTVETGKVCPVGWHVADSADWKKMIDFLGGMAVAGGKLKEAGTAHWTTPNTGANNSSGFGARGGGFREPGGDFKQLNASGNWWTSTANVNEALADYYFMVFDQRTVQTGAYSKAGGLSIRCVIGDNQ